MTLAHKLINLIAVPLPLVGLIVAVALLWNRAILSGGTTRVSMLLYLEPAVSVLGAVAFLGERITLVTIAGGLLILAGVVTASLP